MNAIECADVAKAFGEVTALDGVELVAPAGCLTALLGPSGCGKSTLLRVIAGFERPDRGTVSVTGRTVAAPGLYVPPEGRRAGIVPQQQALFPHMTVAANVGYGLGRRGRRGGRVAAMMELCGLDGLGRRMPHELSGGQQQRVALARALAPEPAVVLLDEPFASLDATLRADLRAEVAGILRAAGQTALLVTHDQDEALSMAETVAVMRSGRIVQQAPPADIYQRPADEWLAGFVGEANLIDGEVAGDGRVLCALGSLAVVGPDRPDPGAVRVMVRPEQLVLGKPDGAAGVVQRREYHGHDAVVWVLLDDASTLRARLLGGDLPIPGSTVTVSCQGEVVVFAVR